ncbi:MAG TPA: dienelactone hydrolase family protein [Marmoricola sp.]|nr:dienelactone hydrolase family protein [Marmoricola sp.]HNI69891.1 dienelactone hydrolase family protein [Marmoricola sp.]HNJ78321.1 dienelactone hydrolase family protein [Marmoricola sp.]HNO39114.1 dienelactone hydrolase family protein [Marmoricola sp.]
MADDSMADFTCAPFTSDGFTHDVFWSGSGPAVIVMAEMPGITPNVLRFARWVRDLGCTVVLPDLFGKAGFDSTWSAIGKARGIAYGAKVLTQTCVRKEFVCWATGRSSPVVAWLRALGREAHQRCGGPGIGAVGMCFTGGFALSMATDDRLLVPVLSQPANPFGVTSKQRSSIDISDADLATVQQRCAEGLEVIGLRFTGDRLVPPQRFAMLREKLGDSFIAVELPNEAANPEADVPPHSMLTEHVIDQPGQPTRAAVDLVLDHLHRKLVAPMSAN